MAEERRSRAAGKQAERPSDVAPDAAPPVAVSAKKKKLGKAGLLFILLLLVFGVGTGLHFSGIWDARPLVWEIVPQIPYIGRPVANFLGIPEQYSLTVAARRVFELNERQRRLDERERDLLEREVAIYTGLTDIAARSQRLADLEETTRNVVPTETRDTTPTEEIAQIRRDLSNMSARNAAQIVEEMSEGLAVEILQGMPSEARASILSRMNARRAARLVEFMSSE
jgi:flagellar motility protein MotE (MotC chaperone)